MKSLIHKYDLSITLTSNPNKSLFNALKLRDEVKKHDQCHICDALPDRYTCKDKYLVYKFICKYCNESYIGQSSRPFYNRYNEHRHCLKTNKTNSALTEHCQNKHASQNCSITDFQLQILDRCKDPINARLSEARHIKRLSPSINRKHELTDF